MSPRPYVLGEPLVDAGLPPWDGTGIPLPVDDEGWPVVPDNVVAPAITSPVDGATVGPYAPIEGTASPGTTVDLYFSDYKGGTSPADSQVATAEGTFRFIGTTALKPGELGITVGYGPLRSETVTVTVVDDTGPVEADFTDEGYDPSEHTVTEVKAYLDENADQTDYVLDRERAGKARATLIGD